MKIENRHHDLWHPMVRVVHIGLTTQHGATEDRHRARY